MWSDIYIVALLKLNTEHVDPITFVIISNDIVASRTYNYHVNLISFMLWGFTSQSTGMVMSRRSVHLASLFSWARLTKRLTSSSCTCVYTFACNWQQPFLSQRKEENGSINYGIQESMGLDLDHNRDPLICSQTRYRLI